MSGVGQSEEGVEASTSGMMETSMMESEDYYNPDDTSTWTQKEMSEQLCRICAKPNQYLIPIFEGEGIEHQLETKIQKHLPIEVSETDELPLQVCYQCASTLIAWNDLVIACIEADKKLRQALEHQEEDEDEKGPELFDDPALDSDEGEEPAQPSTSSATAISGTQIDTSPVQRSPGKAKKSKLHSALLKNPTAGPSGQKTPTKKTGAISKDDAVHEGTERCQDKQHRVKCKKNKGKNVILKATNKIIPESPGLSTVKPSVTLSVDKQRRQVTDSHNVHSAETTPKVEISDCNDIKLELGEDTHKSKQLKYSCTTCHRTYSRQKHLIQHQKTHGMAPDSCEICSKQFYKKSVLRYHMMLHTGDRPHKCSLCDRAYIFRSSLNTHIFRKHQTPSQLPAREELECSICRKILTSRKRLEIHLQTTHNGEGLDNKVPTPKVLCPTCGKAFSSRAVLRAHERLKHEIRPKQHICEICGLDFPILSKLTEHMEKHLGIKKFTCDGCGAAFHKNSQLKAHRVAHTEFRPFACKLCNLAFKENRGLKRHEECVHGIIPEGKVRQEKSLPCIVCGKKFTRPKRLEDHMRVHSGERPFSCDQCPKSFFSTKSLRTHMRTVHWKVANYHKKNASNEPEVCDICNKSFKNHESLQNHLRRIHEGKKETKFTCAVCKKVMHGNAAFRVHMLIHNDEYPFSCDKCDKRVRTKYQLQCHMLNHTGVKSFACEICNRSFVQKSSKFKHMKKYHTATVSC